MKFPGRRDGVSTENDHRDGDDRTPLFTRTALAVRQQRLAEGRDPGLAGGSLKEAVIVGPGMRVHDTMMDGIVSEVRVIGGSLQGFVRTAGDVTVTDGLLSGYIETDGDIVISGGRVSAHLVGRRIMVRGNGVLDGVICASDGVFNRDAGVIDARMVSDSTEVLRCWSRSRVMATQDGGTSDAVSEGVPVQIATPRARRRLPTQASAPKSSRRMSRPDRTEGV